MDCKYKVNIKNIQYNYKIRLAELQEKYKFNLFCTGGKYDDTEIREEIASLEEENEYLNSIVDQLPKVKVEGEYPTLDNTLQAKMKVDLKGNTQQNGTPTPDTPIPVQVVSGDNTIKVEGKNLVNYDNNTNLENKYLNASGSFESAIYTYVNGTIKANSNKITISFNNSVGQGYARIGEYKEDGTFIKRTLVSTTPTTLTLDSNTSYLIYSIDKNSDNYFEKLQLEKSNQATTYEPYQSQSYPISLRNIELCKIGDYQDKIYKDNGKWYLNKQIGKVVLDGSEDWAIYNNIFYKAQSSYVGVGYNTISNYFIGGPNQASTTNVNNYNPNNSICCASSGTNRFYIKTNIASTTTDFKTWLSTHNTTVYYVLATPTTTEITDTTLISQLEALKEAESYLGQTSISQVNNDAPFIINASTLYDLNNLITRVAILETE